MTTILDQLLPVYDFRTRYTRRVGASPEAVWAAIQGVTGDELPVARALMMIRHLGSPPMSGRLLDVAPMPELRRDEGRETVHGRVARFWRLRPTPGPEETRDAEAFAAFAEPGWAKAALAFRLTPIADGRTLLAAETRVRTNDPVSRRKFAPYWALIRLGGAMFIRLELLRAIARRAEAQARGEAATAASADQ